MANHDATVINAGYPADRQTNKEEIRIDIQEGRNESNAGYIPDEQTENEGSREIDVQGTISDATYQIDKPVTMT